MPLPLILGIAAGLAGTGGVAAGISGVAKMSDAKDVMREAQRMQEDAVEKFQKENNLTVKTMDNLGKRELEILQSFEDFSCLIERIQGRPEFKKVSTSGVQLVDYTAQELDDVSIGATALLGGIGGAAAGTAGGFAAAGVTTSAVMALGTASTGTAITSLGGAAATNATLAALGGGSLASGGGGMALGATVLGGATLGVGLLVGGVIFNLTGSKLSNQADEAYNQAKKTKKEVNKIVKYLSDIRKSARKYIKCLDDTSEVYVKYMDKLRDIVEIKYKWKDFTDEEKLITENTVLLVGVLYNMCKVKFMKKSNNNDTNELNNEDIEMAMKNAKEVTDEVA